MVLLQIKIWDIRYLISKWMLKTPSHHNLEGLSEIVDVYAYVHHWLHKLNWIVLRNKFLYSISQYFIISFHLSRHLLWITPLPLLWFRFFSCFLLQWRFLHTHRIYQRRNYPKELQISAGGVERKGVEDVFEQDISKEEDQMKKGKQN